MEEKALALNIALMLVALLYPPQFAPILPQFSSDIHLIFTIFYFLTLNICVYRIKPLLLHIDKFMCN